MVPHQYVYRSIAEIVEVLDEDSLNQIDVFRDEERLVAPEHAEIISVLSTPFVKLLQVDL